MINSLLVYSLIPITLIVAAETENATSGELKISILVVWPVVDLKIKAKENNGI